LCFTPWEQPRGLTLGTNLIYMKINSLSIGPTLFYVALANNFPMG